MKNKGLVFCDRKKNIQKVAKKNGGIIALYGMTYWATLLIRSGQFDISYVCDKKAIGDAITLDGIPVVNVEMLDSIIRESGARGTVISCTGINKSVVESIYLDLIKYDIPADFFDYFDNDTVFNEKYFEYNNKQIQLYEHSFNCGYVNTRMTERSVELALAQDYIKHCSTFLEIGAVTPYYFCSEGLISVIDPTDRHKRVDQRKSLFELNFENTNVLSISTVEHVGTGDFEYKENKTAIDAIQKIVGESSSCLITAPTGYNFLLDQWVCDHFNDRDINISLLKRTITNHWKELKVWEEIPYTSLWANGLIVISKNWE